MKLLTYAKNFLELRLRALIYALFALLGFIAGLSVAQQMGVQAIGILKSQVNAAILREYGQ